MNHPFISYFHEAFARSGLLSVKFPYTEAGRNALESLAILVESPPQLQIIFSLK